MENAAPSRSLTLGWKIALLLPLAVSLALQVVAHEQHALHAKIKFSTIGNTFLCIALIAQSLLVMRRSRNWGITMLIVSSATLGFGVNTLLRVL
jgi:hypothetical protein